MNQWQIIPEAPLSGPVWFGVEALSGAIRSFAPYWPKVGAEDPAFSGIRVALAGPEDGVHLDAASHRRLGKAIAAFIQQHTEEKP